MLTMLALTMVLATMTMARSCGSRSPRARASCAGRLRALSFQRSRYRTRQPMTMKGSPSRSVFMVAPVMEPMSQKVMAGSTSCGSAAYFTSAISALKKAEITRPERISMSTVVLPRMLLTA